MKKIIIIILIILVAVTVTALFVWPAFGKVKIAKITLQEKNQQLKDLTDHISQINALVYKAKTSESQIAKIDQALLDASYLPSVFQLLQTSSSSTGARIEKVQLGKEIPVPANKNIIGRQVNITVLGDYVPLRNFLMSLEKSARLIAIDEIHLNTEAISQDKKSRQAALPAVDITFEVFSYINNQQ